MSNFLSLSRSSAQANHSHSNSKRRRRRSFKGSNATDIFDFLRSSNSNGHNTNEIQELICEESIHDEDLPELERLLIEYHRSIHLSALELPHNSLTSKSTRYIASILNVQHETLLYLNLAHNAITSIGLQELIEPIQSSVSCLIHLDLTGNNLGSSSGDSIAQLLRNNTVLQKLNLTNNQIGTKGIKAIVPALTTNSTLKCLNLSYNNIKARGAALLATALEESSSICNLKILNLNSNAVGQLGMKNLSRMLTNNRTIESLYIGMNNIGEKGAAYLAFAIKHNYTIRLLHINDNQIGPNAASILFDQLKDDNRTILNLNLAWNNIGIQGAKDLTEVFKKNAVLTDIDLSGNQIGSDGVILLANSLSYNISLKNIDLSNNHIDDSGAYAMSEAICDPTCSLQNIQWEDNPDISVDAIRSLSRTQHVKRNREYWLDKLVQNLLEGNIHSINLSKRKVGNEEVLFLVKALMNDPTIRSSPPIIRSIWANGHLLTTRSLIPLFELSLSSPSNVMRLYLKDCCNAGDEKNMEAIAKYLPNSKSLQVLYMAGCSITKIGAMKVAHGLKHNTTLRRLNLDNNQIGDDGLIELASAFPHKALTSLSVNRNNITDSSMGSQGLTQVEELHLNNNAITDFGALELCKNLKDGCLTWLSLLNNQVTERGGASIRAFMPETIPGSSIVDY